MLYTEYDHLSTICKAAEGAYLDLYKLLRDAPDPQELVARVVTAIEAALAGFARVEDIFSQLENNQSAHESPTEDSVTAGSRGITCIRSDEEFQERLQVDMAEVASSYDMELKKREQILRDSFEQQRLQDQQQFDSALAQKDAELFSLNETLLSQQQSASWHMDHEAMLQIEMDRREAAEDKARLVSQEVADLHESLEDLKARLIEEEDAHKKLKLSTEIMVKDLDQLQQEHRRDILVHQNEVTALQKSLRAMPSFDLCALADKLGVRGPDSSAEHASPKLDNNIPNPGHDRVQDECPVQWPEIEDWLIATVRKVQSEASTLRARDHDRQEEFDRVKTAVESLSVEVEEKRKSIVALEQDLATAYSSIEAGKALLQCHGMMASNKAGKATDSSLDVFSASSGGDVGAEGSKDVKMMKAVLEQRDRMMKQAHSKQQEASKLQTLVERLESDKNTLKLENAELYKRIRVIRANSMTSSTSIAGGDSLHKSHIKKRSTGCDLDDDCDIESKYAQQYEDNLDLFQLEALDRMSAISRLNVCERGLSYMVRFVMQDRWLRHALLVYLFIVHIFALGYTVVVLNPDIEHGIDEQWSRISKEDMNQEVMHPDNWA
jgi:homeobox protein cut-like